jgi:hypothetical protein
MATYGRRPTSSMSSHVIVQPDFDAIEDFIRENQQNKVKAMVGLDLLVRTMALAVKGFAQEKSAGPVAPRFRSNPALAHRIPVQRITGDYFAGWTQKRIGMAAWRVENKSKEARLIEDGLYQRARRPILKLSILDMYRLVETTRAEHRLVEWLTSKRKVALRFTALDMATRGANNPNISGPSGRLP